MGERVIPSPNSLVKYSTPEIVSIKDEKLPSKKVSRKFSPQIESQPISNTKSNSFMTFNIARNRPEFRSKCGKKETTGDHQRN